MTAAEWVALADALAWPVVTLLIALLFRKPLRAGAMALFQRIEKVKAAGTELVFAPGQLREEAEELPMPPKQLSVPAAAVHLGREVVRAAADAGFVRHPGGEDRVPGPYVEWWRAGVLRGTPFDTISLAHSALTESLMQLATRHGRWFGNVDELALELAGEAVISNKLAKLVVNLRRQFLAAAERASDVTKDDALNYTLAAARAIDLLDAA